MASQTKRANSANQPINTPSIPINLQNLDARPDRLDLRDRVYCPPVQSLAPCWPDNKILATKLREYLDSNLILNQGQEGACTGFGLACVVNYLLWRSAQGVGASPVTQSVSPRMLYHLARFYDEWPGEDYEGSSCRGALKAWHKHGVCLETTWPYRNKKDQAVFVPPSAGWDVEAMQRTLGVYYRINKDSVVDMQAAIQQVGAIYVSASVHTGWWLDTTSGDEINHQTLPSITLESEMKGGHAFALVGYNDKGFVIQNSWGTSWGLRGFAIITYEDWVQNGSDAWVCGLGVPQKKSISQSHIDFSQSRYIQRTHIPIVGKSSGRTSPSAGGAAAPWDTSLAYRHTVVMENDGRAVARLVTSADAADNVDRVAFQLPSQWLAEDKSRQHVVIYAHGGLNTEEESIQRICHLAPYFKANNIYPIFLTWHTGFLESLTYILEDKMHKSQKAGPARGFLSDIWEGVSEAKDRMIEVVCRDLLVKAVWTQIKQNAEAASGNGKAGDLLIKSLQKLKTKSGSCPKFHLIGHSAGSIILGKILEEMDRAIGVTTCSLYAPACTVDFANQYYARHWSKLRIHLLSDEREKGDGLPTASAALYGKSLLYLVSRALEQVEKTPILGMERAFDPSQNSSWNRECTKHVENWQKDQKCQKYVLSDPEVSTGPKRIPSAHGCFDNDVKTVTNTLKWILGSEDSLPVPVTNLDY